MPPFDGRNPTTVPKYRIFFNLEKIFLPVPLFSICIFVMYRRTSKKTRKSDLKKSLLETDAVQALLF